MALQLWVSNSLVQLNDKLSDNLLSYNWSVLQPMHIVTQTEGMNIWLKQALANKQGIVANVLFDKPNDIIFKVYQILNGAKQATFNRDNLTWLLFEILHSKSFVNRYPLQAAYFVAKDMEEAQLKRLKLAEKLADLFDQYQIYRQQTLLEWSNLNIDAAPNWQAYLWKAIQIKTKDLIWSDKNQISQFVLQTLKEGAYNEALIAALPIVNIFGLSVFTRYHLEIWFELARIIDIHFYLLNPAPHLYWGDDKNEKDVLRWQLKYGKNIDFNIGNDLLTSWGKLMQQTFQLIFQNEEAINAYEIVENDSNRPLTLLGTIQGEVENNSTIEEREQLHIDLVNDNSVTITAHFTILREIEVLYQHILKNIQLNNYSLRDIIVLASDIDLYAPYIKAVFDNAFLPLKYKIADESSTNIHELFQVIASLIDLDPNNFSNESIISLLSFSIIKDRFQIFDIDYIKDVINSANIICGIKGDIDLDTYLVSWEYGLDRIIYGICMSEEPFVTNDSWSFFPIDVVEGNSVKEVLSFVAFVKIIIDFLKKRNTQKTPLAWVNYLEYYFQLLFDENYRETDEASIALQSILDQYKNAVTIVEDAISFDVFRAQFSNVLVNDTRQSGFLSGGITFSSMVPMRSIPFKMVCMLGMNYDKFPRKEQKISFNLLHQQKLLGDRNIKESDYHLFLETILSSEQQLYISYIGKSVKDNAVIPPSILVDELLKYIQIKLPKTINATDVLVKYYSLYDESFKYSHDANINKHIVSSSFVEYNNNAELTASNEVDNMLVDLSILTLNSLVDFFKNPIKYYFNKRLHINYFNNDLNALKDEEPFEISYFDNKNVIKSIILNKENTDALTKNWKYKGVLPFRNMGAFSLANLEELAAPIRDMLSQEFESLVMEPIVGEVKVGAHLLNYQFDDVSDKTWFLFSNSKNINVDLVIKIYYYLVVGKITGEVEEAIVILPEVEEVIKKFSIKDFDINYCKKIIKNAIPWMEIGINKLIPYFYRFDIEKKPDASPSEQMKNYLNQYSPYPFDSYVSKLATMDNVNVDLKLYNDFLRECILPALEWFQNTENK